MAKTPEERAAAFFAETPDIDDGRSLDEIIDGAQREQYERIVGQREDADWGYAQMLRADRAELELKEAERKLARLMQMADSWETTWGEKGVKANTVANAVRLTIRPHA